MTAQAKTGLGLALLCALVGLLPATAAEAGVKHFKLRAGPYKMGNFNVKFPKEYVPAPKIDGFLTDMDVRLVDRRGRQITIRDTMLHHVVFKNASRFFGRRKECRAPNGEAFFGTGEERQSLNLPEGYGYPVRKSDRWRMNVMLMSHAMKRQDVYVEFRGRIVTGSSLKRVVPYWVSAHGCSSAPSYPVEGDGGPGSLDFRTHRWHAPISGRIVAAGGHLHGGAVNMEVRQPRCENRVLFDHKPLYGYDNHIYYKAKPVLHEPGPINTRWFTSKTGWWVNRGEPIDVIGIYDNSVPHTRVMAITHLYIHPQENRMHECEKRPRDMHLTRRVSSGRLKPPAFPVPLNTMDDDGEIVEIERPAGAIKALRNRSVVTMRTERIWPSNVRITAGTSLTYRFADPIAHNLTFASGPRVAGSPTLLGGATYTRQFRTAGQYKFFCYLHPLTMHQVVDVLPVNGELPPGVEPTDEGASEDDAGTGAVAASAGF